MDTALPFTVTFLGNTNLLFDDGENAWMTDTFFTRPNAIEVSELTKEYMTLV